MLEWGVSAVGSARHWQCRGHGFKSRTLHHLKDTYYKCLFFHAMSGFSVITRNTPKTNCF